MGLLQALGLKPAKPRADQAGATAKDAAALLPAAQEYANAKQAALDELARLTGPLEATRKTLQTQAIDVAVAKAKAGDYASATKLMRAVGTKVDSEIRAAEQRAERERSDANDACTAAARAVEVEIAAIPIPALQQTLRDELKNLTDEQLVASVLKPPEAVTKLKAMLPRFTAMRTRVLTTKADAAKSLANQRNWAKTPFDTAKRRVDSGDATMRKVLGPKVAALQKQLDVLQKKLDAGDFKGADAVAEAVFYGCAGLTRALDAYASDFPAYQVERDKAEQAIEALRRHAQASAIAAEIADLEGEVAEADGVASKADLKGWEKATAAVQKVPALALRVKTLADKLQAAAAKLPALKKKLAEAGADETQAAKMAVYAQKALVEENCSEDEAVKIAQDANHFVADAKLDETDALMSARVKRSLVKGGVAEDKAEEVGKNLRAGGTSSADDAKALGKDMSRLPKGVLQNLNKAGVFTECCRGPVTDSLPELKGVQPRGWPSGMSWDSVPGLYDPESKRVLVGTMDDGGKRKVPGPGEGPQGLQHGASDLVGHEAGHAFDVSDGGLKSQHADFLKARDADVALGATGMHPPRDNYFLKASEVANPHKGGANTAGATSETFAESFAMHCKGGSWDKDWPNLRAFWRANPWRV